MLDNGLFIDHAEIDGSTIVVVRGEIDMLTAPILDRSLERLDPDTKVIVDCSGVEFLDSTGLRVLLSHSIRLAAHGGSLHLRGCSLPVRYVIEVSGLDHLFETG